MPNHFGEYETRDLEQWSKKTKDNGKVYNRYLEYKALKNKAFSNKEGSKSVWYSHTTYNLRLYMIYCIKNILNHGINVLKEWENES